MAILSTGTLRTLLAAGLLIAAGSSALANGSRCGDRDKLVSHLAQNYQEQPAGMGLQSNGHVLELFASRESGSWTILVSRPDGISCIAIAGEGWQGMHAAIAPVPAGPGA